MLAGLYCLDMLWYVLQYTLPNNETTDYILNLVTCIIYLLIPVGLSTFFIIYIQRGRRLRHFVGLILMLILAISDIANIFTPIVFYHKDSYMVFRPFGLVMHILCFGAFMIFLADMVIATAFDYENIFLAGFVGLTMLLGFLASWINYDFKTLWVGLGIAYILMYLAVSELYNKKDVITNLPNRNAYEKTMAYIKDKYNAILMVDMNDLKKYNDTKGHKTGDRYIYATARTLADAFEGHGRLYRVGGDEFCLVSKDSEEVLDAIAASVLEKGSCDEKYGDFPISFAYGIAKRHEGDTHEQVYDKADRMMYANKDITKEKAHGSLSDK
ncbi:diguanylate cyclase (GGDEF) domain-containing protein [Butyrivibrio sp. INlla16]|nr:diguanylate cyclase (GGDEF) domain-containing protein [Butyrivibrio sp. INlla16]